MAFDRQSDLGALWSRVPQKGGRKYMKGKLKCPHCEQEVKMVIFSNDKRGNEKAPDARIFLDTPREGDMPRASAPAVQQPLHQAPQGNPDVGSDSDDSTMF